MRKSQISLLVLILLTATVSLSHAYPQRDEQIRMTPFWQNYVENWSYNIMGCQDRDTACYSRTQQDGKCHSIGCVGCTLTSMAMLYWGWGFHVMPGLNHEPMPCYGGICMFRLNPGTFNNYLSGRNPSGGLLGFDSNHDFNWYKTTTNFYYYDESPGAYGLGLHYKYLVPNYNCAPMNIGQLRRDGTVETLRRSASCFMTDWSEGAMSRLNYDISWPEYRPAIMKIDWTDLKPTYKRPAEPAAPHPGHFVVIAGYEKTDGRADNDGWYRAHNPMFHDNASDNIPKTLNGLTQYGKKDLFGRNEFRFDRMVTLYRFTGSYSDKLLNTIPEVYLAARSPVEMQVIDPDGNMIGYDPETGSKFLENPMSLYYQETPVTPLDGTEAPSEPAKILSIAEARQGSYIFKIFGTGNGPYTIDMELTKSDGTPSLVTALTGTATPSLSETYRVTYSPTGEASLSQTNQPPVASAGADQAGEQSYEITLDGSGSSDPDGDPITYAWSIVSEPEGSMASLPDVKKVNPNFTPDKAGTYVLQLVVNDYFTDSTPSTGLSTNANHSAAFGRSQCKLKIGNCKFVVWPEAINCL